MTEPSNTLELTVNSHLLVNCSKLELFCKIKDNFNSNLNIWWTFRNQNISQSSDIIESYSHSSGATNHSKLSVECAAQTVHDGVYVCNARHTNTSQPNTLYTQAANVSIFSQYIHVVVIYCLNYSIIQYIASYQSYQSH